MAVSIDFSERLLGSILTSLRTTLHSCPEIAGREARTSEVIGEFMRAYGPDEVIEGLGGFGLAAVFEGRAPGPTVMVRADLDALEVEPQPGTLRSAAHRCGHDGHMAIVSGLAPLLFQTPPAQGRVVLLYQPAEETGEGARRVLDDPRFEKVRPDFGVGLHNLPGQVEDTVVVRAGTFSCASVGMTLELIGSAAHAAEPEQARSPSAALAALLADLPRLSGGEGVDFRLCTITHAHLGEHSFGATPERAVLGATLRAHTDEALELLRERATALARRYAQRDALTLDVTFIEAFPATRNDPLLVDLLRTSALDAGYPVVEAEQPFRWSEDFGHFAREIPSVYFGLGIGVDAPPLHATNYNFRDASILPGVRVLHRLVKAIAERGEQALLTKVAAG